MDDFSAHSESFELDLQVLEDLIREDPPGEPANTLHRPQEGRVSEPSRLRRSRDTEIRSALIPVRAAANGAAREVEIREGSRRARRRVLGVLLLIATTVGLCVAVAYSPLLDVDVVLVRGTFVGRVPMVLGASEIQRGDALLEVDEAATAKRILEIPWVQSVRVKREFPTRVVIDVVEREPVAQIESNGEFAVVDESGRVLEINSQPSVLLSTVTRQPQPGEAAEVFAAGGDISASTRLLTAFAAEVPDQARGILKSFEYTDQREVISRLAEGGEVRYGPATDQQRKVLAAVEVLSKEDLSDLDFVDVSTPTVVVVQRRSMRVEAVLDQSTNQADGADPTLSTQG